MADRKSKTKDRVDKYTTDPELANYEELSDISDSLEDIADSIKGVGAFKGEKGEPGVTPKKGKDYFTETEANEFLDKIYSRIKIPKPKDGVTPVAGVDYPSREQVLAHVSQLFDSVPKPVSPVKGVDYSDGSPDTAEDIRNKLELLRDDERLDAKYIKNIHLYVPKIEQMQGRGAWSGSANPFNILQSGTLKATEVKSVNFTGSGVSSVTNASGDVTVNLSGGSGTPGGSDTQVQFNDASAFGGDAGLTYNKTTDTLTSGVLLLTTDLAVTEGGTGASTAAGAVTNLGLDNTKIATISFIIDGGGSTITTGIKGDLEIPFACTINRVTLLADQSGSVVVDIWKDTYANYPPTVADTITAAAKPTITTATKSQDATLTGWTTSITAGDTIRFNVDSITTCTRVLVSLKVTKT